MIAETEDIVFIDVCVCACVPSVYRETEVSNVINSLSSVYNNYWNL